MLSWLDRYALNIGTNSISWYLYRLGQPERDSKQGVVQIDKENLGECIKLTLDQLDKKIPIQRVFIGSHWLMYALESWPTGVAGNDALRNYLDIRLIERFGDAAAHATSYIRPNGNGLFVCALTQTTRSHLSESFTEAGRKLSCVQPTLTVLIDSCRKQLPPNGWIGLFETQNLTLGGWSAGVWHSIIQLKLSDQYGEKLLERIRQLSLLQGATFEQLLLLGGKAADFQQLRSVGISAVPLNLKRDSSWCLTH